jgi:predicted glycoside hydrolase/deacetylase ChbG (UPF0249 family)
MLTSGSAMVPCAWFPEIAAYAQAHPQADIGLHLTLTSERPAYRWGPVASRDLVPTLVDADGFFPRTPAAALARMDPRQVEIELRAQIARARALGLQPTHLDAHHGILYSSAPLWAVLRRIARELGVPVRMARERLPEYRKLGLVLDEREILLDRIVTISADVPPERWGAFYADFLRTLPAGVTELVIHPGRADDELRAATADRPGWGAEWRQRDLDFVTGPELRRMVREQEIELVTWRALAAAARG